MFSRFVGIAGLEGHSPLARRIWHAPDSVRRANLLVGIAGLEPATSTM